MNHQKRIVIVGATSSIAQQCARQWNQESPANFVLIGRNKRRLNVVAKDLQVRNPKSTVEILEADFINAQSIQMLVDQLFLQEGIDIALIAHGSLPDQSDSQNNLNLCKETLEVNGVSPCLYAEAFAGNMSKLHHGSIAIIGSVAGDRGRKSNYIYGAAKGLVARYTQGLQHRFAGTGISISLIKPGPTDTPMTAGIKGSLASAEDVAKIITNGINQKKAIIYAPKKWWLIMMIIRHLPNFIFNKLNI